MTLENQWMELEKEVKEITEKSAQIISPQKQSGTCTNPLILTIVSK